MRVLLVSEGRHELGGALEALVRRLSQKALEFERMQVSDPALRVHAGKGPGYFKKALRCIRYAQEQGFDAIVLVIDQDDEPSRRRQLDDAQTDLRVATLPRALGVAIRTFDAWMLADERALTNATGQPVQRQPDPETIRDPKGMCKRLRESAGLGPELTEMYAALATALNIAVLEERCRDGFAPFARRVRSL